MFYSFLALAITVFELVIVIGGHLMASHNAVYNMLVYGSPFYLIMTLIGSDSVFMSKGWVYPALLAFHLIKYFIIFRAQMTDERNWARMLAIILEIGYLCLSAYYNN